MRGIGVLIIGIVAHNYMRYYGDVITNVTAFATWWGNLATVFVRTFFLHGNSC